MKLDHAAALEWAAKYESVQGDTTVGNCQRVLLDLDRRHEELLRLAKAYFAAKDELAASTDPIGQIDAERATAALEQICDKVDAIRAYIEKENEHG